jgi:hypothetical protein
VHTPVALTLEWRGGEFHIKQTRAGGEIDQSTSRAVGAFFRVRERLRPRG